MRWVEAAPTTWKRGAPCAATTKTKGRKRFNIRSSLELWLERRTELDLVWPGLWLRVWATEINSKTNFPTLPKRKTKMQICVLMLPRWSYLNIKPSKSKKNFFFTLIFKKRQFFVRSFQGFHSLVNVTFTSRRAECIHFSVIIMSLKHFWKAPPRLNLKCLNHDMPKMFPMIKEIRRTSVSKNHSLDNTFQS